MDFFQEKHIFFSFKIIRISLLPKEFQAPETRKRVILKLLEADFVSPSQIFTPEERQKAFHHLKILEDDGWVKNIGGKYSLADKTEEFIKIAKRMCEVTKSDELRLRENEKFKRALKKLICYSLIVLGKPKMEELVKLALISARGIDDVVKICEREDAWRGVDIRRRKIENFIISSLSEIGQNVTSKEERELINALIEVTTICRGYFRRLKSSALEGEMIEVLRGSYKHLPSPGAVEKDLKELLSIIAKSVPEERLKIFEKAYREYIKKSLNS